MDENNSQTTQVSEQPLPKQSKSNNTLIIILVLLILSVLVILLAYQLTSKPKTTTGTQSE